MKAAEAVAEMFEFCELPEAGDPEKFLTKAIELLTEFPPQVMMIVAKDLPTRKRRPDLADLREACERAHGPLAAIERRRLVLERTKSLLGDVAAPPQPEEIERVTAMLKRMEPEAVPDGDLKGHRADDPEAALKLADDAAGALTRSEKWIRREYQRLGKEPVFAGPFLVSPSLAKLIKETWPVRARSA